MLNLKQKLVAVAIGGLLATGAFAQKPHDKRPPKEDNRVVVKEKPPQSNSNNNNNQGGQKRDKKGRP